tara:strand:- start:2 stop:349 length:348 start_codon:yes stop_codon:yes gene_type:complete
MLQKFSHFIPLTLLLLPQLLLADGIRYTLESPIAVTSIEGLLLAILNAFIVIAIPIVVLFIIYSGFLYVTARGNVEQTKKATTSLTYAIIGGVILIGAVAITEIVANVVDAFRQQ